MPTGKRQFVDRANPARLDLPTSPGGRLRQLRTLSAITRCRAPGFGSPIRPQCGSAARCPRRWRPSAPQSRPSPTPVPCAYRSGLEHSGMTRFRGAPAGHRRRVGGLADNSTAKTHFSFTNALGFVSSEQAKKLLAVAEQFPRARWILALHHHLIEYPRPASALSERIGTALINGSWFVRQLQGLGRRAVAMHGHRHIDWIGACGSPADRLGALAGHGGDQR